LNLTVVGPAEGLYTEMDFRNEALNALRMQQLLEASEFVDSQAVIIPKPFMGLTTRYVLARDPMYVYPVQACCTCTKTCAGCKLDAARMRPLNDGGGAGGC
jgi:predicted unusual protein kinase regulating ubiquinone biosynthesis (AarF/ABC1/UbiB family)